MARVSSWANPNEYVEALQAPERAFSDPALRAAHIITNQFGLPRPISGNFATVFEVETSGGKSAVRCFMREVTNQQERYAAIAAHLKQRSLPFMVNFEYLPEGIRVRGAWYPILKMDWAAGIRLDTYIEQHLDESQKLRHIAEQWIAVCRALRVAQIAHGDLQHGNILVTEQDTITLIDYDDMIVPDAIGLETRELGHRHYQHPTRSARQAIDRANFAQIDNFSSTVIGASLMALSLDPSLWAKTKAGDENLLFRDTDYAAPEQSAALQLLTEHADPRLRAIGDTMLTAIHAPSFLDVPALVHSPLDSRARRAKSWLVERVLPPKPDRVKVEVVQPHVSSPTKPDSWVFDYLDDDHQPSEFELPEFDDAFLAQERLAITKAFERSRWRAARWLVYPYLLVALMLRFSNYALVIEKRHCMETYRSLDEQMLAVKAKRSTLSRLIVEADRCQQQEIRVLEQRLARVGDDLQYTRAKEARELVHIERILNDSVDGSDMTSEPPVEEMRARERQYREARLSLETQQRDDRAALERVKLDSDKLSQINDLREELHATEGTLAALRQQYTEVRETLSRYERITRWELMRAALRNLLLEP